MELSCLICGLARNCASALPDSLRCIERLERSFRKTRVVAVANDSVDRTDAILSQWAADSRSRILLHANGIAAAATGKTERLAILRNFYLRELRRWIEAGAQFDLMIVLDLDGVNRQPALADAVCDALATAPRDWGALFANQRQAYYDIWALRHPRWCTSDCWQEVERSVRFVPRPLRGRAYARAVAQRVGGRQVRISPDHPPIPVESAFGGLGIYKVCALDGAWYAGRDDSGRKVCEHVAFNACVRRRGWPLYIVPSLLNEAPAEHLTPGAGAKARPWE